MVEETTNTASYSLPASSPNAGSQNNSVSEAIGPGFNTEANNLSKENESHHCNEMKKLDNFILQKSCTFPQFTTKDDPLKKNPLSIDPGLCHLGKRVLSPIKELETKRHKAFQESPNIVTGELTLNGIEQLHKQKCCNSSTNETSLNEAISLIQSSSTSANSIVENNQAEIELSEYMRAENLNGKFLKSMKLEERSSSPVNSASSLPIPSNSFSLSPRSVDDETNSIASDSLVVRSKSGRPKRRSLPKYIAQWQDDSLGTSQNDVDDNSVSDDEVNLSEDGDNSNGLQFLQPSSNSSSYEDFDDQETVKSYHSESFVPYPSEGPTVKQNRNEDVPQLPLTQSSGILPAIPSNTTRERSYLVGSLTKHGSLLGVEELHKYFPNRMLKVFVGTWNMQKKSIPRDLNDFLLPKCQEYLQDVYVIGVQEATQDLKLWEIKLQETLGLKHVLVHSVSHGVLHLSVYIRRDLVWFCSSFEEEKVTTRMVSQVKTKGAVAIGFHFFGTSLLFINSHFHSGQSKVKERIEDYNKIRERIKLPKHGRPEAHRTSDVTSRYDCIFWFGDLNFRVDLPHTIIQDEVKNPDDMNLKEVLKGDQLLSVMRKGRAFKGFGEHAITFRPTYKFLQGSDEYAAEPKLRTPSYTDRILFKCKENSSIVCNQYISVPTLKKSDHRPVLGFFEVGLKPGRDNIPYGLVKFRGDVYEKAARLRAHGTYQNTSSVCAIL